MKIICTEKEKENFINNIIALDCQDCPIHEFCSKFKVVNTCREIPEEKIEWEVEKIE